MACNEHIRDLLPDYYLGQLSQSEAEEVRHHLATDPECREALEEVEEALGLMPFAAPAGQPPPDLKARTLSRALGGEDPEIELPAPLYPAAQSDVASAGVGRAGRRSPGLWRRYRRYAAPALSGVLLIALVALSVAYLDLRGETAQTDGPAGSLDAPVALAVEATDRAPEARGTVVMASGGMALDVYNLPAPPEGHSYHAWLVGSGDRLVDLGEMELNQRGDARMTGDVQAPGSYEKIEVTAEPEGSEGRSGPVYLETRL